MPSIIENYILEELEAEEDFPGYNPSEVNRKSPEELLDLMTRCSFEYGYAVRQLRQMESNRTIREHQIRVILMSGRYDLIQNERLRGHLELLAEDPKFKWTLDGLTAVIYIEQRELFDRYNRYEKIAKQALEEHKMWNAQLMWYQSENKLDGIERLTNKHRT